MARFSLLATSSMLAQLATAAYYPPPLEGVKNQTTKYDSNISVSYKETTGKLCETTPNVKSYSGYVSMSPASLEYINGKAGFPVNTFYWFFESRKDPQNAPFVLWLGGGPGFSGISSAINEEGPCTVNDDSNSTRLNPYSWNNEANILYIDSPAMTGYSYDRLVNGTIDAFDPLMEITPAGPQNATTLPDGNNTFQVGTFGSQDVTQVSNSTGNVAAVLWTTMQAWFDVYPQYKPASNRMNIWTESYGGRYGPLTADYFLRRSEAIANGSVTDGAPLRIDTLGIINGWSDPALQTAAYPAFVNKNTYGIKTVPDEVQAAMQQNLTEKGGCLDAIQQCQSLTDEADQYDAATDPKSNQICSDAFLLCETTVEGAYLALSNRSQDDIAHPQADPTPTDFYTGFFNRAWVQQALGVPVNFTANSIVAMNAFVGTGDGARSGSMPALGRLLDAGTQVVLVGGDRDWQVNWFGIEAVSLAVNHSGSAAFHRAGYTDFTTANGTKAGLVRQADRLSFVRVFQAGHQVPAYQPEAALTFFSRAMAHKDIGTGQTQVFPGSAVGGGTNSTDSSGSSGSNATDFATAGPPSVFNVTDVPPPMPDPVCYIWSLSSSCDEYQQKMVGEGKGVVKNFIWYDDSSSSGGGNGSGSATSGVARLNPLGASLSLWVVLGLSLALW